MENKSLHTLEAFERYLAEKIETRGLPHVPSTPDVHVFVQRWVVEDIREGGYMDDGFSLHQNEEDCQAFIKDYQEEHLEVLECEHAKPFGSPYVAMISHELYLHVERSTNGIRIYDETVFSG